MTEKKREYQFTFNGGLYFISTNMGGKIPAAISGGYSTIKQAEEAIELHKAACFKPASKAKKTK